MSRVAKLNFQKKLDCFQSTQRNEKFNVSSNMSHLSCVCAAKYTITSISLFGNRMFSKVQVHNSLVPFFSKTWNNSIIDCHKHLLNFRMYKMWLPFEANESYGKYKCSNHQCYGNDKWYWYTYVYIHWVYGHLIRIIWKYFKKSTRLTYL